MAAGILAETFETAITWDRFESFVAEVRERAAAALGPGTVTCRLTHAYPDGAAPYFTVLAPARRGSELEQWAELKAAASEAIIGAGGTITHHHAVGPRPPSLVRPSAPGAVRRGAARRQGRARPRRDPQSRRARGSGAYAVSTASATSSGLHPVAAAGHRPPELAQPPRRRRRAGAGALVQVRRGGAGEGRAWLTEMMPHLWPSRAAA